ncbi:hypothetical protein COXBURSA331_A0582 [Coxiella burnetii RSA 331]|nr:hypothetical protein COXBURSA331_A0582 [Coxiella burnetii RSA 331]
MHGSPLETSSLLSLAQAPKISFFKTTFTSNQALERRPIFF